MPQHIALSVLFQLPLSVLAASSKREVPALEVATRTLKAPRDGEPSGYPGGDSTECTNEFRYLNFDASKNADLTKVRTAHEAFCTGWPQLIVNGEALTTGSDRTIFSRYFEDDEDEENKDDVQEVWEQLLDFESYTAQAIVKDMILDNNDWAKACPESGGDDDGGDAFLTGGYWGVDPADEREKFHLCDDTYDQTVNPSSNECADLDDYPSAKMESVARMMLHETLHYQSVGPKVTVGNIVDELNDDDLAAYFPQRTHGLIDPNQDNNAIAARNNANSYAWLATNAYYKVACTN